jgi:hypothetical protein
MGSVVLLGQRAPDRAAGSPVVPSADSQGPLYGVPSTAVSTADVTAFARTYGRPGGSSGAAGLYRSMLTEGEELRALAKDK